MNHSNFQVFSIFREEINLIMIINQQNLSVTNKSLIFLSHINQMQAYVEFYESPLDKFYPTIIKQFSPNTRDQNV
jgi:hypothetical protein